ncbi:MAG: hypothetical protein EOS14_20980 [Mesorhizobium sp.]|nr:MAG: hypothetical protein EOS14_20980 [Mesorhizobium sp.]
MSIFVLRSFKAVFRRAPLWPAGHLPHREGDWMSPPLSPIYEVLESYKPRPKLPISPPVGEMAGRPEGGATELDVDCKRP